MPICKRSLLLLLLILPMYGTAALAQVPSNTAGLRQRMSSAEFSAAGLNKLSPQELQNLNDWLRAHPKPGTIVKMVDSDGKPVFYPGSGKRQKIFTHVKGQFVGWGHGSVYTLANGQVWKQLGSDTVSCSSADSPSAKIKPSFMGDWLMYVSGCNGSVHVKRIR